MRGISKFIVFIVVSMTISFAAVADSAKEVEKMLLKKEKSLNPDMSNPGSEEYPDWFKNSFLDLREDIEEAAEANKRVLLFFYQDGCPYCKKMIEVNLAQKAIADKMRANIDAITINMWGDREVTDMDGETLKEKDFAVKLKVMYTPTMLFLDENGKVILRVNGYYKPNKFMTALNYVTGKHEKASTFRAYYKKSKPPKSHGKLHEQAFISKPPHNLTRIKKKNAKPLMVLFEQKQCPACDELHSDVFNRVETLGFLEKFDVVQFDMWSKKTSLTTPDGKQTTANKWANDLDIKYAPSLVFFDQKGKEVFRVEAYLKAFHFQSILDYVSSEGYKEQPSFQRWIEVRADRLREKGVTIDLMN